MNIEAFEKATGIFPIDDAAVFYRLTDRYAIYGYDDADCMIVDKILGNARVTYGAESAALLLANSRINYNIQPVPQVVREMAKELCSRGILAECAYQVDSSLPLKKYHSRYFTIAGWAITGKCNMKCKHCFLSAPDAKFGELTTEQCISIIHGMADAGIHTVALVGGEPLIRKDFFRLVDELLKNDIYISDVSTNGLLVNQNLLDEFKKRNISPKFYMSFDGVGWHDWLRGTDGYEDILIDKFRLLRENGFRTGSAMCLHSRNVGTIRASVNKLAAAGVSSIIINRMVDTGEWKKNGYRGLSIHEQLEAYLDYLPQFYEDGMPANVTLNRFVHLHKNSYRYELLPYKRCRYGFENTAVCNAVYHTAFITSNGKLAPCITIAGVDGQQNNFADIFANGFADAINNSDYAKMIRQSVQDYYNHNPECKECGYSEYCLGGCRAQALEYNEDDYLSLDKITCTFFKEHFDERIIRRLESTVPQAVCSNLPNKGNAEKQLWK